MISSSNVGARGEPKRATLSVIATLCSIFVGLALADQVSDNLLPLTLHRFTADASVIGLILAIHPAFGLIAQPTVGVLSDRIWTRIGRRGFFLVLAAPATALCLFVIPQVHVFWQLVVVIAFFQFFLALLWGSDHPLLADLVPAPQRTLAKACMMTTAHLGGFAFLKLGMGYGQDRFGEGLLY